MASAVTTDYLSSVLKILMFESDPDNTVAVDISWQDMRDYGAFLGTLFHSVGTGTVVTFKLLANSASNGSGTDAEVKAHALGSQPDAVGDWTFLECLASELPPLATSGTGQLRYVSLNYDPNVSTDEFISTYVFGQPRFAFGGLTAEVIA